jgi:hypothetical protein
LTIEVTIAKNKGIGDADNYLATKLCLYLGNKYNASYIFDFPKFFVFYFCGEVTEKDIKRCNDKLFKQGLKGFHKLAKGIEIAGKIATLIERIKERFFKLEASINASNYKARKLALVEHVLNWTRKIGRQFKELRFKFVSCIPPKLEDIDGMMECMNLMEDMCRLPRAITITENFSKELSSPTIPISFVKPQLVG